MVEILSASLQRLFSSLFQQQRKVVYCDAAEASVRCQVTRTATMKQISVADWSLYAELQKGVSQQCLVMTKMVVLKRNSTVVSISHSSALAQPRVLMSRSPREKI